MRYYTKDELLILHGDGKRMEDMDGVDWWPAVDGWECSEWDTLRNLRTHEQMTCHKLQEAKE